ncbi:B12-binding domain-containing radical SAM protein [bacterium]|nr:B12-binding domain-containing radical SAM protein [bacterium]
MRVLFIVPWMKSLYGDEYVTPGHPHVGIAYLSAVTKKEGHDVKIYDQGIEKDDAKLFQLIELFKPQIIAITAFSYCYKYVVELINCIQHITCIPVVVGGPHVSAVKNKILIDTGADFAIKGEGEISFINFLNELSEEKPQFERVDGLIWRNDSGEVIENKDQQLIKDLDALPFPDYEAFKLEKYNYYAKKTLPVITSRGCPYGCNYCSVQLSMGRGFRPRSSQNVVDELEYWYRKGFNSFEFNDDCFSLNIERAKEICRLIIKKDLKIKWQLYNGIRVDRINEELLKLMKESGCIFISYGCESGDQDIINNIGKGITLEQVNNAVELTNKVRIKNSVNFIIGHPGETYDKAIRSLKFAEKLPTDFVNVYNIIPYPGTMLYKWIDSNGKWLFTMHDILENIGSRDLEPVFETPEFTKEERIKALKKGFALYEKTIMKFRFGKFFGSMAFYITRIPYIYKFARIIALDNKIGNIVYTFITSKSRE